MVFYAEKLSDILNAKPEYSKAGKDIYK